MKIIDWEWVIDMDVDIFVVVSERTCWLNMKSFSQVSNGSSRFGDSIGLYGILTSLWMAWCVTLLYSQFAVTGHPYLFRKCGSWTSRVQAGPSPLGSVIVIPDKWRYQCGEIRQTEISPLMTVVCRRTFMFMWSARVLDCVALNQHGDIAQRHVNNE
jgi:hypothetical protein